MREVTAAARLNHPNIVTAFDADNVNGVHLLEHLKLDELAAKKVYEFAFMMTPLKLEGATGSTVAPLAIR